MPPQLSTGKGRQASKGRQKITIATIREKNKKHVTFSKRRNGLFKKASELCVLCGADVAIVTFSEAGKAFSFGHPNAETVISRYLHGASTSAASSSSPTGPLSSATASEYALMLHKYNEDYEHLKWEIKKTTNAAPVASSQTRDSNNSDEQNHSVGRFWWQQPVDGLELHELEQYCQSLEELRNKVASKAEEFGPTNDQQMGRNRYNNDGDCKLSNSNDNKNGDSTYNSSNNNNNDVKIKEQEDAKDHSDNAQIFGNGGGLSFMNHHLKGTLDHASGNGFGIPRELFPLGYNIGSQQPYEF